MARTKGSGWGNGYTKLWQVCPYCKKKKMYYMYALWNRTCVWYCTACKEYVRPNDGDKYGLIPQEHKV